MIYFYFLFNKRVDVFQARMSVFSQKRGVWSRPELTLCVLFCERAASGWRSVHRSFTVCGCWCPSQNTNTNTHTHTHTHRRKARKAKKTTIPTFLRICTLPSQVCMRVMIMLTVCVRAHPESSVKRTTTNLVLNVPCLTKN
jgi:hypothetical protein